MERLRTMKTKTILIDGWEDMLRRSLYGTASATLDDLPVILGLEDMSGFRGSATKVMEVIERALKNMDVDMKTTTALVTDNPTVMQAFRRQFKSKYSWVIVSTP